MCLSCSLCALIRNEGSYSQSSLLNLELTFTANPQINTPAANATKIKIKNVDACTMFFSCFLKCYPKYCIMSINNFNKENKMNRKQLNNIRRRLIIKACDIVGSKSELARELGVTRQFVHSMTIDGNIFPPTYAIRIDKITKGQIRKEDLAPELYPE